MENIKRRIAIVNSVYDKSTGKIAYGLLKYFEKNNIPCIFCYGHGKRVSEKNIYKIDTWLEHYFHAFMTRITGHQGGYSYFSTKRMIKLFRKLKINTVYGIGLHGYYLNEKLFFKYLIKDSINFVYIMTEEYAFLGKCGYSGNCTKYLTGCGHCPNLRMYPKSLLFDSSAKIFRMKKNAYTRLKHTVFVGPKYTILAGEKSPLLKNIRTEVIDEAINTDFYTPRNVDFLREELGISKDQIVLLCVAPTTDERKRTELFAELARRFQNESKYIFLHVGYMSDKKNLPKNYIAIGYVENQNKLACYYSLGDLFVFPSVLDTMPNACLEALSCGTPLLCFNTSGLPYLGGPDVLTLVESENIDQLENVVRKTNKKTNEIIGICREYALKRYNSREYFMRLDEVSKNL